ncbi:MAG: hypothetical protein MHPSP_000063 [Paramarteilia canceri]
MIKKSIIRENEEDRKQVQEIQKKVLLADSKIETLNLNLKNYSKIIKNETGLNDDEIKSLCSSYFNGKKKESNINPWTGRHNTICKLRAKITKLQEQLKDQSNTSDFASKESGKIDSKIYIDKVQNNRQIQIDVFY